MDFVRTLSRRAGRLAAFLTVVGLVVLVDQATKAAVNLHIPVGAPVKEAIPGLIGICHVENTGAAFSLGEGASPLFAALALVALVACTIWVARDPLPLHLVISLAAVAGGGAGNMVDRLVSGSVTDFIATQFMRFPVFNVADICVTLGVVATFVGYVLWEGHRPSDASRRVLEDDLSFDEVPGEGGDGAGEADAAAGARATGSAAGARAAGAGAADVADVAGAAGAAAGARAAGAGDAAAAGAADVAGAAGAAAVSSHA